MAANIPLIEQFKTAIKGRGAKRLQSRRSARTPFKSVFAKKTRDPQTEMSLGFALETVQFSYQQTHISFDFRGDQTRGTSVSPTKHRTKSSRLKEIDRNPSFSVMDFYGESRLESKSRGESPKKVVLPRLPIVKIESQAVTDFFNELWSGRNRTRFTYEMEDMCLTQKQSLETTRFFWRRRNETKSFPLLILNFDGVLGNLLQEGSICKLLVRNGLHKGSALLYERFQIAVLFPNPHRRSRKLLSELMDMGLELDAGYKRRRKRIQFWGQDYEQIFTDFGIRETDRKKVIVLGTLLLEQMEVGERRGWDLIYEPTLSQQKRIVVLGLPTSSFSSILPLFILLPSAQAQENYICPTLDSVAELLLKATKTAATINRRRENLPLFDAIAKMNSNDLVKCEIDEKHAAGMRGKDGTEFAAEKILVVVHSRLALKRCNMYNTVIE